MNGPDGGSPPIPPGPAGPLRLAPGSLFAGEYKVVRPLKSGGQGSLYVVEQLSTSKQRALKLMLPELVAQPTSRKRFELEARIAARIPSDHVVDTIASGVDAESGTPWLVMELLEGKDLAVYTREKKRLPPEEVLEIFSQLCHALGEAHAQGIIHRDLKPENIFLATPRRRGVPFMVKVLDFGIARILAESSTVSGQTSTGVGTPMWMAPEQTIPGGAVGPSTDVWPLGLIAFRLLTGYLFWKAPYDSGASVMMLMAEAFMHPLPTASDRAAHYKVADRLPPGFDVWFARCVARPMDERFANAAEAFSALEPVLAAVVEEPPRPSRVSSAAFVPLLGEGGPTKPAAAVTPIPDSSAAAEPPASSNRSPPAVTSAVAVPSSRPTGPGRATWEGAPELAADAVISAEPGAEPSGASPTGDHALPVPASASSRRRRTRNVILVATAAGVIAGAAIFGFSRGGGQRAAGAGSTAPVVSVGSASVPEVPLELRSASASVEADPPVLSAADAAVGSTHPPDEPAPSAAASIEAVSAGAHRRSKLCKQTGAKCFSNDDCCDRSCRKWTCRANAALENPYPGDD